MKIAIETNDGVHLSSQNYETENFQILEIPENSFLENLGYEKTIINRINQKMLTHSIQQNENIPNEFRQPLQHKQYRCQGNHQFGRVQGRIPGGLRVFKTGHRIPGQGTAINQKHSAEQKKKNGREYVQAGLGFFGKAGI